MTEIQLTSLSTKQGQWLLRLQESAVVFLRVDAAELVELPRSDASTVVEIINALGQPTLVVRRKRQSNLLFKLVADERQLIESWLGPPNQAVLRLGLRRRYGFAAPLAAIFMLTSLPLPADESAGFEAMPFDALGFVLGLGLLLFWLHAKFKPKPYLFLFDSAWFGLLAVNVVVNVANGSSSPMWLLWVLVLASFIRSGIKQYRRFKHLRTTLQQPQPAV
jgi:hypothetical protein